MAPLSELVDVISDVENESLHVYNKFSILLGRFSSKMSGGISIFLALRTILKREYSFW